MKTIILENATVEDTIPGIGIPEGKTFEDYAIDLRDCHENPYCTAIGITTPLLYADEDYFTLFANREEHAAFVRFQICKWYYADPAFTPKKPLYLIGSETFEELRMLSGIPVIEAVLIERRYSEVFEKNLPYLYAAAGDFEKLEKYLSE